MKQESHTSTPWFYDDDDMDGNCYELFTRDEDGNVDEPIGSVLNEEDAAMIVKAVNCHAELVEALKWCVADLEAENSKFGITKSKIVDDAKAALAKAGAA